MASSARAPGDYAAAVTLLVDLRDISMARCPLGARRRPLCARLAGEARLTYE
jgi:hypothetical protein